MGEWLLPEVRIAFEYSYNVDYSAAAGGTGNRANGVFSQLTLEW